VRRWVDGAADFSLSACIASGSRGGDGQRVLTGIAEGEERGGGNRGRHVVSVADVASEMTV
jgi:hypothetical protein